MENKQSRILSKNSINQFLIKIDFDDINESDIQKIIKDVSKFFDRTEKVTQSNIEVNLDESVVNKTEGVNYVLVNESTGAKLIFSKNEKTIAYETKNYIDKNTYKSIFDEIIKSISKNELNLNSKRIGMRFINTFNCNILKNVTKIFNLNITKNIIYMASQDNISRVISQEEYNFDSSKCRIQYGILNKFYPAILKNYDLTLDIDSFDNTFQNYQDWENIIDELNHKAFTMFINCINEKYFDNLK
jgi:uncharacterized protein (TIGR04255 family)